MPERSASSSSTTTTTPTATPASDSTHQALVHYGTATEIREQRAATLDGAYATNPARFRHRRPEPPKLSTVVWINEPQCKLSSTQKKKKCVKRLDKFRTHR